MKRTFRMRYHDDDPSRLSAEQVVPFVLSLLPVHSVVCIGCHRGQWLSVMKAAGVAEIAGVDGPWVDMRKLMIPREVFHAMDLVQPFSLGRQFDLVICLEVAEHLPAARAASFVRDLTALADVVLFAAAIPGQAGDGHINEQWPDYWIERFGAHGYLALDVIRPRFSSAPEVSYFYAQNTFLYANESALARYPELAAARDRSGSLPVSVVHPGLFTRKIQKLRDRTWPGLFAKPFRRFWGRLVGRPLPERDQDLRLPPSALIRSGR